MQSADVILGATGAMVALREQIERLAAFDAVGSPHVPTVLLQGETGTGKGLAARAIHETGPRARGPFVDVNCAAIPDTMLEAELFGFEAGAFTDARRAKPGLFEASSGGTLFLDEIDSLTPLLQSKALKAIEEKSVRRLGSVANRVVDSKLIAATQKDLRILVRQGTFRADLYHRLMVVVLEIPPLRRRAADIPLLARHFLQVYGKAHRLEPRRLSAGAERWLLDQDWPGNVRELGHLMERATLLATASELDAADLEQLSVPSLSSDDVGTAISVPSIAESAEPSSDDAAGIKDALRRAGGNVVRAAQLLGIGRNALRYRMRRLGIDRPGLEDLARGDAPETPAVRSEVGTSREAPRTEPAVWENKTVTVLAIEITFPEPGSAAQFEPWTAIQRWSQRIEEQILGFGGVVFQRSPARASAMFGIPRAIEQSPQRAVQAALAIRRMASAGMEPRPELRLALHLGTVLASSDSDRPGDDMLSVGQTLTLPERLLGHTSAGEILVSSSVARRIEDTCDLEARELKLGSAPSDRMVVYSVLGPQPRSGAGHADRETRFVGRDRDMDTLLGAFAAAREGQGQLAFVVGDAGIGKSRLLLEFQNRVSDGSVLWLEGRCASYGATTALLPIAEGLRRWAGIDDRDDDAGATDKLVTVAREHGESLDWTIPFLKQALSLDAEDVARLDSASLRSETFRALSSLVLAAAAKRPVILVIEDLHWIDPASEEFLSFLADAIPTSRILLICSYRPGYRHGFGDRSYHVRVALRPLSEGDMAVMTQSLLRTEDLAPAVRTLIARKAEGNPFFVEEVTRSLLEDGSLRRENGGVVMGRALTEVSVPDTIQEVLAARIDRLADDARQAIQIASVIGREFALRLLERITHASEGLRSRLDELRSLELIYEKAIHPELAYMFKHALTHEVAYSSLILERRKDLHRTIGRAIEELYADRLAEHFETLAHHFGRGEDWEKALLYHERASEKAASAHANRAAVEHCRQALAIADRLDDRVFAARRSVLEERIGLACLFLSEYRASGEAYERAAALNDGESRALLLGKAAQSYFWGHCYPESEQAAAAGLAVAEQHHVPRAGSVSRTVNAFSSAVLHADFTAAARIYEGVAELGTLDEEAQALIWSHQASMADWTGDYRRSVELNKRVLEAGKSLGLAHLIVWSTWFLGKTLHCLGDFGTSLAMIGEAYQVCDRIGDRAWKSRLLNTLGWCHAEIGDARLALEFNQRAAVLGHEIGDLETIANAEINLALNHLALGDVARADETLAPIEESIAQTSDPWMLWRFSLHARHARARIELARGELERGIALLTEEAWGAHRKHAPKLEARALHLRGSTLAELERWDEARGALGEALRIASAIGHPPVAWRTHLALAGLERRLGAAEAAGEHERQAKALLESVASSLADPALKGRLLSSSEPA